MVLSAAGGLTTKERGLHMGEERNSSLFRTIIDNIEDGVYFVDLARCITLWNQAAARITGYSGEEMLGRHCDDNLLSHVDQTGTPLCVMGCPLYHTMQDGLRRQDEVLLRHKNGHRLPVIVRTHPIYRDGEIVGAVEIFSQKTPARYDDRLVQSLADRAMKDTLTGLPNKVYLENYIDYKLSECRRYQMPFSLLVADVDDLAVFNRHYGQAVGDVVLQSMAESFRGNFSEAEKLGVWRGGTFVGVFDYAAPQTVYDIAEKMRVLALRSTVYYLDSYLGLTVSIGLTLGQPEDTVQSLVARAEGLALSSKHYGKNCSCLDVPPP